MVRYAPQLSPQYNGDQFHCGSHNKSEGLIQRVKPTTSPFGVNTYTRSSKTWLRNLAITSPESVISSCHASNLRNQGFFLRKQKGYPSSLFVFPVCCDAKLRIIMHLLGTNLHFNRLTAFAQYHSMNGLIAIRFRIGDIVIKFFLVNV